MKFLQTSDWHLGKTFHELNLEEDQKFFLDQVYSELKNESETGDAYDGLLIPGDIYDRPVPPADAVRMLSKFLGRLHEDFPGLQIFILSGNHDSADRLSFLKDILTEINIHITTDVKDFTNPVILEQNGDKCAVYQLPFLYAGSFFDEENNAIKRQNDLYEYACKKISEVHHKNFNDFSSVLCCHLMTVKSLVSDSERSFVGTAEEVDASLFDSFDYTAVGHLHSYQAAGELKKVVYSGAPLSYSFDDKEDRFMLKVNIHKGKEPEVTKVPIQPLHKVVRLKGPFESFYGINADNTLIKKHENDFVEILVDDAVVPEGAVSLLRTNFKNLLSFRKETKEDTVMKADLSKRTEAVSSNNPDTIFESFFTEIFGTKEDMNYEKIKKVFLNAAKENNWGEQ